MTELSEAARRVAWRVGRRLYCAARGEGANRMAVNGESYVQGRLLAAADRPLTVLDVGANIGDWTQSLLDQHASRPEIDLRVFAFEPIPETYKH